LSLHTEKNVCAEAKTLTSRIKLNCNLQTYDDEAFIQACGCTPVSPDGTNIKGSLVK
jgi:hypothetical protein